MVEKIHIHDIFEVLKEYPSGIAKEELRKVLKGKFGHDEKFATCGVGEYGFEDILVFMQEKNKILIDDSGKVIFDKCGVCEKE